MGGVCVVRQFRARPSVILNEGLLGILIFYSRLSHPRVNKTVATVILRNKVLKCLLDYVMAS